MWPPFQASEGRLAQLTMTLAANATPLLNHGDLGRCVHEQFCVFPFIFNSFYEVGTDVRRTYGCVTTNTWEMIWRWVFLQIPLDPSVPFSPPQPSHLSYILYLHWKWGYFWRILAISWPYILGLSEHFQHTLITSSPHLHSILTTLPKQ